MSEKKLDPAPPPLSGAKMVEIDQICRRFEAACKAGQQPPIEDFLGDRPEPERSALRRELEAIAAEFGPPAKQGLAVEAFVQRLTESGLITAEEVRAFLAGYSDDKRPANGQQLAQELYRRGKLTKFQAQAVYQGKTRSLVVGNYVILDTIGKGGMGQVYKAQHKKMKRIVALKVLPTAATKSSAAIRRFQREVEAAAKLSHPNIVTAYDADEAHGVHFLVMEYVDGKDLASLVKDRGPLDVATAVECILQAAQGLEYAHQQGIVHRDIKPHNLLWDKRGTVKVLDLGLARMLEATGDADATSDHGLTQSGQVMGTLDYMSPEQAEDTRRADARADIYSLGCTLYYLLTGRGPYSGDTLTKKILAHREQPIPSLRAARKDVSEALDALFQRILAKRPEDRPQTMGEVIAELKRVSAEVSSTPSSQPGPATPGVAPQDTISVQLGVLVETTADPLAVSDLGASALAQPVLALERYVPRRRPTRRKGLGVWMRRVLGQNEVAPQKSRRRRDVQPIAIAAIACVALVLLILLGFLLISGSAEGTLVVEISEPDVLVQVLDEQGQVVTERRADQGTVTLHIDAGKYRLRLEKGGVEIFARDFTLAAEGTETIPATQLAVRSGSSIARSPGASALPLTDTQPSVRSAQWTQLFTGSALSGWTPVGQPGWTVKDGVLTADGTGAGWLASPQDYTDFELELEYRLPPGGNSGVFVHAWPEGPTSGGRFVEVQLLDDPASAFTNLGAERRTGAIYGLFAPQSVPRTPAGQWHRMTVRAAGRRLDVTVNGTRVLEADLDECAAKFPEHEGLQRTSGRIGLQMLRTVVEFRNVRVRELPAGQATSAASSAAGLVAGGNLVGTTWEVTDSDGDRYTWTFQADGVLHYQADRGLRTNGTWRKDGNAVHIETNSQYATLDGDLYATVMSGKGASRNGRAWTWRATLR